MTKTVPLSEAGNFSLGKDASRHARLRGQKSLRGRGMVRSGVLPSKSEAIPWKALFPKKAGILPLHKSKNY